MRAQLSAAARRFARNAISDSTRATYAAAVRAYGAWCAQRGVSAAAADATPVLAAEWFAALGADAARRSTTLHTYGAALRSWWAEETLSDERNPFASKAAERVLKGAIRVRRTAEAAQRKAGTDRPRTLALTPALLHEARPYLFSGARSPRAARMLWAAACVGVYGMLRPNEFLGAYRARDRSLRASQLAFFARAGSNAAAPLRSFSSCLLPGNIPDRFTLQLGVTKADPLARNAPHAVAAEPAVRALWEWLHERRETGDTRPELFTLPDERPLSVNRLCKALKAALEGAGHTVPRLTGRCFRRGGNSGALAGGASLQSIQRMGRWRSVSMVERYADDAALEERALAASRAMAPRR